MEIKKQYLEKYLHAIALEQIADEYVQKGYKVSKEEKMEQYHADLVARKENETIVIEIKSGKLTGKKREEIARIGDYVRSKGNKFFVAVVTPPKEKKIEIANIEHLLEMYMVDDFPNELDELSTHTRIEEVADIEIDEISIEGKTIFINGAGVVNVSLQFGSDGDQDRDDGFKKHDRYPFEFEISFEYDEAKELKITEVSKLEVDTSSFYE